MAADRLSEVKRLYLMPMGSAMDQYLANRLTATGRFVVVTDPQQADAVMTDRIGQSLKDQWLELYPVEDTMKKDDGEPPVGRFAATARGRGNFFLLDRESRAVLWSIYERPQNNTPDELDRIAGRIAGALVKGVKGPKK